MRSQYRFLDQNVGGRTAVLIRAIHTIKYGEEITISCGDDYFPQQGHACKCGVGTCLRWNQDELEFNDILLEDAFGLGTAPDWVSVNNKPRKDAFV